MEKPIDWEFLRQAIESDQLQLLGRTNEQLAHYDNCIGAIKAEFATVGDYILHKQFGYNYETVDGKKVVTLKEGNFEEDKTVFVENDFPYYFVDGISHYLIWSHKPVPNEQVHTLVREKVPELFNKEYLFFTNPPHLQSVKSIRHVHILLRDKPQS